MSFSLDFVCQTNGLSSVPSPSFSGKEEYGVFGSGGSLIENLA
jgi:hypothetical protein